MDTESSDLVKYNVVCRSCNQVWQPALRSPLWWKAKQRAEQGFLDALRVSGQECGCIREEAALDARYRVIGYNEMCEDFEIPYDSLVPAAKKYLQFVREGMCVVFFVDTATNAAEKQSAVELRLRELAKA